MPSPEDSYMASALGISLVNAVVWACILAMVSLGLTLIYGQLEIINITHGAMYAIGAVTAFYVTIFLGNWAYSLLITPLIMAIIAMVIYNSSLRFRIPAAGYPLWVSLIIAYGFMFILEQLTLLIYGGAPRCIASPIAYTVPLFGVTYPAYRIFAAAASLAIIGGLVVFLRKTRLGLWIRAATQDHDTASAMGVPVPQVYMLIFILGSILAGLGGTLVAPMTSITHNMGAEIIIDAFIVVIIAGFGSIPGTVLAALILSLVCGFFSVVTNPVLAKGIGLGVMIVILYIKPTGLLRY